MTDQAGQPKYLQVAAELRRAIRAGTYPVGSELPSTAKLTQSYGVSTTVVRAAIRELRDEGLVLGHSGKAVYVTAEPGDEPASTVQLESRLRELAEKVDAALRDIDSRLTALERQPRSAD